MAHQLIPITSVNVTTTVDTIKLTNISIQLFQKAIIDVVYQSNGEFIKAVQIVMEGDAYNNWLDDDQYLIDWVLTQLSLTASS